MTGTTGSHNKIYWCRQHQHSIKTWDCFLLTFMSLGWWTSSLSPRTYLSASGHWRTSRVCALIHLPTSFSIAGYLKRSGKWTAMFGSSFQAVRIEFIHVSWRISQKMLIKVSYVLTSRMLLSADPIWSLPRRASFIGFTQTTSRLSSLSTNKRRSWFMFFKCTA